MFGERLSELAYYLDLVEYVAPPVEGYANDALAAAIASAQANSRPLVLAPGVFRVNVTGNGSVFVITQPLRLYGMPGARIEMYHDGDRQNLAEFWYQLFRIDLADPLARVHFSDLHITGPSMNGPTRSFDNQESVAIKHHTCIGQVVLTRVRIDGEFKYALVSSAAVGDGAMFLEDCRLSAEAQGVTSNVFTGNYVIRDRGSIFENVWIGGNLVHHVYGNGVESFDFEGSSFQNCEHPIVGDGTPAYCVFRNCIFEESCGATESMDYGGVPTIFESCIFLGGGVRGEGALIVRDCIFQGETGIQPGNAHPPTRTWRVENCAFVSDIQRDMVKIEIDGILALFTDCHFVGVRFSVSNDGKVILRGGTFDNRDAIANCAFVMRSAESMLDAHDVTFLGTYSQGLVINQGGASVTLVDCLERP